MAKKWGYRGTRLVGRNVVRFPSKQDKEQSSGPAGPARTLFTTRPDEPGDTWRTVGSDCPWNSTPGNRQTWRNGKLVDVIQAKDLFKA